MKFFIATLILLTNLVMSLTGQETLTPFDGFRASSIFPEHSFAAFDLHGNILYGDDGDTIRCLNLESGLEEKTFGRPAGYHDAFSSFITVTPDGKTLWAGFTVYGNGDDRIYSMDLETGTWMLRATLPGNFDLEWWNGNLLVSGLNSADWRAPCSIFLMDLSGSDQHRKIVEVGGYGTGIALDVKGNLYCGTSYQEEPNALFRWDSATIAGQLADTGAMVLVPGDGNHLTDLPAGASDCEVDLAGNLVFTFNDASSDKVVARWNGTAGEGFHFDTLALAAGEGAWLGMIKSQGNIRAGESGNRIITTSPEQALTEVHRDYRPVLVMPLPVLSGLQIENDQSLNLMDYFTDPDDVDAFTFEVALNSNPSVAEAFLRGETLHVNFTSPGQTNLLIRAWNAGSEINEKVVVGVQPEMSGDYLISGFEEIPLEEEGTWNGSDGSGGFTSGGAYFHNEYDPEWFSWNGWACSSISDNETPGFMNQYSAITGGGFDLETGNHPSGAGGHYAVAYVFGSPVVEFPDSAPHHVAGLFITNSTFAALSMEHGDAFSKKFGGDGGSDPDFFKVIIWGYAEGVPTGPVEFYLADYRFEDDTRDFLIKTWQWLDLSSLGEVDSLVFDLVSSDVGDWGINTPAFFCVDNLLVLPRDVTSDNSPSAGDRDPVFRVYPNPTGGRFAILKNGEEPIEIKIYNLTGSVIFENSYSLPGEVIDLSGQPPGNYLIRVSDGQEVMSTMIHIH